MTESDWERGYREGRAAGWDLGAIAAYEALPERVHHFDNPFRKLATGGIVRGAGSPTYDRVPFQFSGCQGTGYEVRNRIQVWDHECPTRQITMTLRRGEPCGPCGMVEP